MIAFEIAGGLLIGYLIGSLLESLVHEYIGDAPPGMLALFRRHPGLFGRYLEAHFSHHVVHHHRTFLQSHVRKFDSVRQRAKLEAFLAGRGRHGRSIVRNGFSDRLHTESLLGFALPWIVPGVAIALLAPAGAALAAAVMLALPAWLSHVVHPYLHMPFAEGQRQAPAVLAALLRTGYMKAVYRHHFMHHRHGATSNFNLLLGGDALRGRLRRADGDDLRAMAAAGMPVNPAGGAR